MFFGCDWIDIFLVVFFVILLVIGYRIVQHYSKSIHRDKIIRLLCLVWGIFLGVYLCNRSCWMGALTLFILAFLWINLV